MQKNILHIVLLILFATILQAQQVYHYSLFSDNSFMINPALTGIKNYSEVNASFRKQWHKVDKSPTTSLLSFNSGIPNKHIGFGAFIYDDQTGPNALTGAGFSFAYRILDNEKYYKFKRRRMGTRSFSFGLNASLVYYRLNTRSIKLDNPEDPTINAGANRYKIFPDMSFGFMYNAPKFYLGFSIPQLLNLNIRYNADAQLTDIKKMQHYYIQTGGRIYFGDDKYSLEPSIWLKYVIGGFPQGVANLRFNIIDKGYVGASYRSINGLTLEGGVIIKKKFKIGYAYDIEMSRHIKDLGMTHEIYLSYRFVPKYMK
jgi:type IX secretion system PorP/SprF family membrane protein